MGLSLGLGLGTLALATCAMPWIPATRDALDIVGIWNDPSPYFVASFVMATASLTATAALVHGREIRAWKVVAVSLGILGVVSAVGSLLISFIAAIGHAS